MSAEITFDGVNLTDFGLYAFEKQVDNASAMEYESFYVAGRDGALLYSNKSRTNVLQTYDIAIVENAETAVRDLRNFLCSKTGYKTLTDSVNPDEYYMAFFTGTFEPRMTMERQQATVTIEFERKPQRFLQIGRTEVIYTQSGSIVNPTRFASYPIIRIYGDGTVTVGSVTITVSEHTFDYIDIDCETMNAHFGAVNANAYVSINSYDLISLPAGATGITLTGVDRVEITPRWYEV